MRKARKQERTCSLGLFSCFPHSIPPFALAAQEIYAECKEIRGLHCGGAEGAQEEIWAKRRPKFRRLFALG